MLLTVLRTKIEIEDSMYHYVHTFYLVASALLIAIYLNDYFLVVGPFAGLPLFMVYGYLLILAFIILVNPFFLIDRKRVNPVLVIVSRNKYLVLVALIIVTVIPQYVTSRNLTYPMESVNKIAQMNQAGSLLIQESNKWGTLSSLYALENYDLEVDLEKNPSYQKTPQVYKVTKRASNLIDYFDVQWLNTSLKSEYLELTSGGYVKDSVSIKTLGEKYDLDSSPFEVIKAYAEEQETDLLVKSRLAGRSYRNSGAGKYDDLISKNYTYEVCVYTLYYYDTREQSSLLVVDVNSPNIASFNRKQKIGIFKILDWQ